MIDVTNTRLYERALLELALFKQEVGREHRGRFVQLFLGLKFYQNELPSMFSALFVSTEVLQTLIDDLYAKASRPLNHCVLILFENRYHARTGLISPGNTTPQNTWRNNFNLQKGVGCYGPPTDLASPTFLNQSRVDCRHLNPAGRRHLAGASCRLCPTGARYRNEDHRKWLRIDPGGSGYAVVDLMNIANFTPYVAPLGTRIPLLPLIISLYHDAIPGLVTASRRLADVPDFASDFNFSTGELNAYFDDSATNPHNRRLLHQFPRITYTTIGAAARPRLPRRAPTLVRRPRTAIAPTIPEPVLTGTQVPPPAVNTGWGAEQYVAAALRTAGWTIHDVSRQRLGYDLYAQRGRATRYIDVKSSLSLCSPTFTSREWQQARTHRQSYILAIIENFNPTGENIVFWVPDPYDSCTTREATAVQYSISRTSWRTAAATINEI